MKILILEYSQLHAKLLVRTLEKAAHKCFACYSIDKGLDSFKEFKPDIVFIEFQYIESGESKDFIDIIHKSLDNVDSKNNYSLNSYWVPIIFLMDEKHEDDLEKCAKLGADDIILKPSIPELILGKINIYEKLTNIHNKIIDDKKRIILELENTKQQINTPPPSPAPQKILGNNSNLNNQDIEINEMLKTFTAACAEKIKTPISEVIQSSYHVLRRLSDDLPANHKIAEQLGMEPKKINEYAKERGITMFAEVINNAGKKVIEIIEDLLKVVTNNSNECKELYVSNLIDKTVSKAKRFCSKNAIDYFQDITFNKDYPDNESKFTAYHTEIEYILFTIILNAINSFAESSQSEKIIDISLEQNNNEIIIIVKDNGIGMHQETLANCFTPFFTTFANHNKQCHNGLGLSVAQNILHKYQGKINIDSKVDTGTSVRIIIPKI